MIPFLDLRRVNAPFDADIRAAIGRVLESGWYIHGAEVKAFEVEFARYCDAGHCVGMANGLDALTMALRALGVGPGDEVIVPSNTFIATWLAVTAVGAIPVPVEPVERTYNLDPERVEAAITSRTRAMIPVHLYGQPADLEPLLVLAARHGIRVLEDAAQAQGSRYRGRRIGGHGDAVAWSFYPGKNLGALGDAGAVTTNDAELAERLRLLGNYGSRVKYRHEVAGGNSRLDELQAAVLRVKLGALDQCNAHRARIAKRYLAGLSGIDLVLPATLPQVDPVWHLFVVRHHQRDALAKLLAQRGVATLVHYPTPPHLQQAYASLGMGTGTFPVSERIHEEVLSLPIGPVQTDAETETVVDAVREAVADLSRGR
jgi:dTDP-4-amino-4,6-dideoxygalactose transaminase